VHQGKNIVLTIKDSLQVIPGALAHWVKCPISGNL